MSEQKRLGRPDREKIAEHLFYRDKELNHNIYRNKGQQTWQLLMEETKNCFRKDADQILTLIPDEREIECAFEDWDDTTLPHPVCHCLKREGVDCTNVPDDVGACPDFMSKQDWEIEEAKKQDKKRIENLFDNEPTHCTVVRTQSVEECYVIPVKDWQALKGEGGG